MLKFSEIFEFSWENFYFERIRMVRMVRMVRSLADRTFQLCLELGVRRGPLLRAGWRVTAKREDVLESLALAPIKDLRDCIRVDNFRMRGTDLTRIAP